MGDPIQVPKEVEDFLKENRRTFMITLRKDGSPTGHPMAGFYGGNLYLNMYRKSVKSKNLDRDARISCVTTSPPEAADFRAAVYTGNARLLPVEEIFAEEVPEGLAAARNPRTPTQDMPSIPNESERKIGDTAGRIMAGRRVVYEITPVKAAFLPEGRS